MTSAASFFFSPPSSFSSLRWPGANHRAAEGAAGKGGAGEGGGGGVQQEGAEGPPGEGVPAAGRPGRPRGTEDTHVKKHARTTR